MQRAAFQITADGNLVACDVAMALEGRSRQDRQFWIDVKAFDLDELRDWLAKLGISPFITTRLCRLGEITKVVPGPHALVVEMRVLPPTASSHRHHIAVLCLQGLIITFDPTGKSHEGLSESPLEEMEMMEPTTSGVLCAVLLHEAGRVSKSLRDLRTLAIALDERMDHDPGAIALDEVLELKDQLLQCLSVAEEQLECFEELNEAESSAIDFSSLRSTMRLLLSGAGASERQGGRLEKRISDLRQHHDSHQQARLNHRLGVLTILSAVFLPLTLIAGIWGMNFEAMPELSLPLGYPVALALMVLIAGAMLWFFHRRGWFD